MLLFPIVALTYTFNLLPFPEIKKLRRIGWLKPFIIGFVWSGIVSVYPIIFYQLQIGSVQDFFALPSGWLWLKTSCLFLRFVSCLILKIMRTIKLKILKLSLYNWVFKEQFLM
jgi:hypothetical protein